jgi:hypothetical protein
VSASDTGAETAPRCEAPPPPSHLGTLYRALATPATAFHNAGRTVITRAVETQDEANVLLELLACTI